jgi:hypothetical protein
MMGGCKIRLALSAGLLLSILACQGPEEDPDKHQQGRSPLDSLLGYYAGTVERTICKEPNIPSAGACGRMETDTLPAASSRISFQGTKLSFFLAGFGTLDILPGDTVFADTADSIGTVSCFRIPEQAISPEGPIFIADVPVGSVGEANEVAPSVCQGVGDTLALFTVKVKNDSNFLQAPRRVFRLHRTSPPLPD